MRCIWTTQVHVVNGFDAASFGCGQHRIRMATRGLARHALRAQSTGTQRESGRHFRTTNPTQKVSCVGRGVHIDELTSLFDDQPTPFALRSVPVGR